MVSNVHEMPLIAIVYHDGVRKPSDIASVIKDKPDVDVDTDRVHSVSAKPAHQSSPIACPIGADTHDVYRRHSAPSPRTATESTSMEVRLCAMEEKLSIMNSRISSMDSRLSSMKSKLDCSFKLFSSAYNTTEMIDHASNHLVPPVSISSSPIVESEHSLKIFTQMFDRKLAGGRRKRRHIETVDQLIRQCTDKYLEVFDELILLFDNRLSVNVTGF
ncbi:hypothetical protein FNV43_RR00462 [Rhamnella rubrinervis]|uniref:Uncharacterized protein n=1 Tax=Rhamnella rubrinervis TaxID=2594499 RepID=A0A8K0HQE8_9ROSA|nr:hypothetical protein FNV43_RR00462 [Rhamnella rubrinervis]